ncbi:pentapeptide repeat-containing protein [Crocosphaera sp.]|uniref:pentapeptide repeat-containing protein n=1 Tax=Crocosphaera sp. TaxID=2729996 RepID=UPI00262D0D45|nr:pentapeptide repeat-containing protein [Crocosphaera sp.]MDJ0580542.1 pentapeptide repeat-containing protein [Crocosphaera sp.]
MPHYNDNYADSANNSYISAKQYNHCNLNLTKQQKPLEVAIEGLIEQINFHNFEPIISSLQEISVDNSIKIDYINQCTAKVILNGSQEGLEKLQDLFRSGELQEFLDNKKWEDFSQVIVENICFVEDLEVIKKCSIIQQIRQQTIDKNQLMKDYLIGIDLSGADLKSVNLSWANIREINLEGANLIGANLTGVNLNKSNLSESYLMKVYLVGSDLIDANLIGADLTESMLMGANLTDADLSGVSLNKANLSGADLTNTNLSWANLTQADLRQSNFKKAILNKTHLDGANLTNIKD